MPHPHPHLRPWICVSLALVSGPSLTAQDSRPLATPAEFAIDQWTTEQGLPQNSVNAIAQAQDGYLWIGTFGGLARFDGTSFVMKERVDRAGRHVDRVLSLAVGRDSSLWIGTETGLLHLQDGAFRVYGAADGLHAGEIVALHAGADGTIWIGTGETGLAWFERGEFGSVSEVEGTPLGRIVSIVEGKDGTIWVNSGASQVLAIPGGVPRAMRWRAGPLEGPAHMMLQDRAGAKWFGTAGATTLVSGDRVDRFDLPGGSMVEDTSGGYWMGSINDGLFFIRTGGDTAVVRRYPLPDGRLGYRVRSTYRDRDGSVWVGTDANGLLRVKRNLFTTYAAEHGLSHDVTTAVFGDQGGTMWVGTNCGGVNAIDPDRRTIRTFNPRVTGDPAGDPCVFSLAEGPDGTVWQGTFGGGLSPLPETGTSMSRSVTELSDSVVLALLTDRRGTIWVGTRSGLAAVRDGRVRATYTTADGLAHNTVYTIHEARDGALWIGTLEGLSRFVDGRFTTFTAADGLSSGHVRAIHEDRDGTLWIGTYGGGLNRFRAGDITAITRLDGLADDIVSVILEDDGGNFWMSGNRGIYRVAVSQLTAFAAGRIDRVHSVLYGRADGLRNPETNGGFQPAGWKDHRGHLWFPTLDGVAVVDPARAGSQGRPPSATIEETVVDGVSGPPDHGVLVVRGRSNLEFRYAGLGLAAPEHITFRYRLEGFDVDWVDAGVRRVAYYPRLPPGTYRFQVRAANRDGVWGAPAEAVRLRVAAPVWSTWPFRLGALAALVALVALLIRRREAGAHQERLAKEEFSRRLIESQEQERKRVAGELHDGLGQEFLIVRNRLLLAARADGVDGATRERLRQMTEVVTSSLSGIREIAHNLAPHQLDHLGLSAALETMAEGAVEGSGIDMDVTIESIDGLLPAASQINLYRIVQEALTNMVRHSAATAAVLHVRRVGTVLRVTLSDNGRGFHAKRDARGRIIAGFGLSGMTERARILGGRLDVQTAPEAGVRIELHVPVDPLDASPAVQAAAMTANP